MIKMHTHNENRNSQKGTKVNWHMMQSVKYTHIGDLVAKVNFIIHMILLNEVQLLPTDVNKEHTPELPFRNIMSELFRLCAEVGKVQIT